jgi:dolichyl-phosphate-mannose--protein O-mannosyl transferase
MYEVSDLDDGKKIGMFYAHELSRVNVDKDSYWRVEKILKKKFVKKKLMYLVKFMNYETPMWVNASQMADTASVSSKLK